MSVVTHVHVIGVQLYTDVLLFIDPLFRPYEKEIRFTMGAEGVRG